MKKLFILLTIAIFSFNGCDTLDTVEYADPPETTTPSQQTIEIKDIQNINLGEATILNLSQGETEKLEISAPDDILPIVKGVVNGDTLTLGLNNPPPRHGEVIFTVRVKDLSSLKISGASTANIDSFYTTILSMEASGASSLNFTTLNADSLTLDVSGASTANIGGTVADQDITVSGASTYSAKELESTNITIDESGASKGTIWVTETLDATLSGASDLKYKGEPKISQDISGASTVSQVD